MIFASDWVQKFGAIADIGYFLIGVIVCWAGVKIYRSAQSKEATSSALTTIEIMKANVDAVEKQAETERDSFSRVISRLEKQVDDLTDRNRKLDDQVKNLSIIPWERQQQNHTDVMQAIAAIANGQQKLVDFFTTGTVTTDPKSGNVKVEVTR